VKNIFIRFLNLREAMKIDPAELDLSALKLLEVCAVKCSSGQRLTVTEAMQLNKIASAATIHRKLNQLIDAGYLSLEYEGQNRRTKYLTPTAKSNEYFTKLGVMLQNGVTQ